MKIKFILISVLSLILLSGCQTIKNKSDEVAEKENEKYGQFVGKQVSELKMELGAPTEDFVNELFTYQPFLCFYNIIKVLIVINI